MGKWDDKVKLVAEQLSAQEKQMFTAMTDGLTRLICDMVGEDASDWTITRAAESKFKELLQEAEPFPKVRQALEMVGPGV